jgi:hypothetical protein
VLFMCGEFRSKSSLLSHSTVNLSNLYFENICLISTVSFFMQCCTFKLSIYISAVHRICVPKFFLVQTALKKNEI